MPSLRNTALGLAARAFAKARNVVPARGALVDGSGWRGVHDILTREGYKVGIVWQPQTGLAVPAPSSRPRPHQG